MTDTMSSMLDRKFPNNRYVVQKKKHGKWLDTKHEWDKLSDARSYLIELANPSYRLADRIEQKALYVVITTGSWFQL